MFVSVNTAVESPIAIEDTLSAPSYYGSNQSERRKRKYYTVF